MDSIRYFRIILFLKDSTFANTIPREFFGSNNNGDIDYHRINPALYNYSLFELVEVFNPDF